MAIKTIIEPFRIKSVEPIRMTSEDERHAKISAVSYNVFEGERMVAACREAGVMLALGVELCFVPKFVRAREQPYSVFGDHPALMHGQGMDAVEFFTQKKVVVERWPKEWSRKF